MQPEQGGKNAGGLGTGPVPRTSRKLDIGGRHRNRRCNSSPLGDFGYGRGDLREGRRSFGKAPRPDGAQVLEARRQDIRRSEEHTSELQSLMRISYAVFCLKKKKKHVQDKITDNKKQ